jgi:hypothetical protein
MSPYLLANSFNFDVTEIMKEVKAAREKQKVHDKYTALSLKELREILDKKHGGAGS